MTRKITQTLAWAFAWTWRTCYWIQLGREVTIWPTIQVAVRGNLKQSESICVLIWVLTTPPTPATALPTTAESMAPCVAQVSPPASSEHPKPTQEPTIAAIAIGPASEMCFGPPHKPPLQVLQTRTSGGGEAINTRNL